MHGVRLLAGTSSLLVMLYLCVTDVSRSCKHTSKELIGIPDRVRRTELVIKERLCDATFAYQQIMVDVHREVQDYSSR